MHRMLPSGPVLAIDARDVTKTFKSGWFRPTRTAARRVAHRPARRHRRTARTERRGEDDAPVDPGDPADAGFGERHRAGPRRGPRRGPAPPAAQHGERPAVVPVEPAGG